MNTAVGGGGTGSNKVGRVATTRLMVKLKSYSKDRDHVSKKVVHYFEAEQIHGAYEMVADWQGG